MSDEQLSHRLQEIAEQGIPGNLDLWQSIRADIEASPLRQPRRSITGRIASRITAFRVRTPVLAALSLTLLLVAFGLTAVPNAQGRIDGMLRRFGLMLVDSTTVKSGITHWIGRTDEQALSNGGPIPMANMGEAQRRAPFPIHLPRLLPEGMTLRDIYVRTSPPSEPTQATFTVGMTYSHDNGRELSIQETKGQTEGFGVPESQVQDARVDGRPALYAQGVWQQYENTGAALQWDASVDRKLLSWESGGVTYVLDAYGLDLSREDMIRIAESIR